MLLASLNVTVNLGQLRKALEHEERWDGHCAKSYKDEITHLHERIFDLEYTVKSINHDLADKDEEIARLTQALAEAKKPHKLTDIEIRTMNALREMVSNKHIRLGTNGRSVLANAAGIISMMGDI